MNVTDMVIGLAASHVRVVSLATNRTSPCSRRILAAVDSGRKPSLDDCRDQLKAIAEDSGTPRDHRETARKCLDMLAGLGDSDDPDKVPRTGEEREPQFSAPRRGMGMTLSQARDYAEGLLVLANTERSADPTIRTAHGAARASSVGASLAMPKRIVTREEALARVDELEGSR